MSSADFRSWRRTVEDWFSLNEVKDRQAVCYIRLLCVPAVQKALDDRYSRSAWEELSHTAALNMVAKQVTREYNQAVCWAEFFSLVQAPGEPVREYFTRCSQKAMDCAFQLRKLVAGLREPALKRDVFQSCSQFSDVDTLRTYCVAYEGARRDATPGAQYEPVVATDLCDDAPTTDAVLATPR